MRPEDQAELCLLGLLSNIPCMALLPVITRVQPLPDLTA